MNSISVGVRLPESLHEKLMLKVSSQKSSKTQVILDALRVYLDERELTLGEKLENLESRVTSLEENSEKEYSL